MGTVDLSREATDFRKRYTGVRMQQGRVLTDDDFNDAQRIDEEDMRRTRVDVIGPVGSPDAGFLPVAPAGPLPLGGKVTFSLSPGTLYLGGLRLEQPAAEAFELQKDWLNFDTTTDQPNLPAAGSRIDLVYLEAYQVPVLSEEDSEKLEAALGSADTSANMRSLRRVAVRTGVATEDCAVAWAQALAAWGPTLGTPGPDMELVTGACLRVTFTAPPNPGDLCSPATAGGYLGAENQAIRVQMVNATAFTWGFDNAAPLYRVQVAQILVNGAPATQVKLLGVPKDAVHWPLKDQVVEILPWSAALPNGETLAELSGHLAKVSTSYNPDDQTLLIDTLLPAGFGTQWLGRSDQAEFFDGSAADNYFFLRVWNRGDDLVSPPAIPVASGNLGNTGLHVTFLGGPLRANDHWIIAARPSTPNTVVPWLFETAAGAPTNGLKRYRAPLGLIRWTVTGGTVLGEMIHDCRRPFLPLTKLRGCCTVTVGDGTQSFGMYTKIQDAINALPPAGGVVCVMPGTYNESVVIQNKANVLVHGCDARSRVQAVATQQGDQPAFLILDSTDIAVERLGLEAGPRSAVEIARSQRVAVRACVIEMRDLPTTFQSIWARGLDLVIERNLIGVLPRQNVAVGGAAGGVLNHANDGVSPPPPLALGHATRGGVQLGGGCERVRVLGNVIRGGTWNGITLGSLRMLVGNNDEDVPDKPSTFDPCEPCRPVDTTDDDDPANVRVRSAGDLYEIEIGDNRIEHMGANGISVIRFFDPAKAPILIVVHGLHIHDNLIQHCLRREIAPPQQAMLPFVGYGGIALAVANDLRIERNEIIENGVSHLEPICAVFALAVENAHIENNRMRDNGPRLGDEPAANAKPGTRGGIWIWLALAKGGSRQVDDLTLKRWDGVPAAVIRDNLIVTPIARVITLFALGPVVVARNRLVSQGTTLRDLEFLASTLLIVDFGISNEWTWGLLWAFLLTLAGKTPNADPCGLAKGAGVFDPATGQPWPPLTSAAPSGKLMVTENQITCDVVGQPASISFSAILALSLDDVAFTDNQCELESHWPFFLVDAVVSGSSVRVADNRFSETWQHAAFSAWSLGLMNTTTDNQATHCLRADALPQMKVFKDNLSFVNFFCPQECGRFGGNQ